MKIEGNIDLLIFKLTSMTTKMQAFSKFLFKTTVKSIAVFKALTFLMYHQLWSTRRCKKNFATPNQLKSRVQLTQVSY